MAVAVTMWLFGVANRAPRQETCPVSKRLLQLQKAMSEYLQEIARMVEILERNGWQVTMGMYDLSLSHPEVHTKTQAEARLRQLGLDPATFNLDEYEEELNRDRLRRS